MKNLLTFFNLFSVICAFNNGEISLNVQLKKLFNIKQIFLTSVIATSQISLSCMGAVFQDEFFQVNYPFTFEVSPKLLKTHEREFFAKSSEVKGYNFGVTMDRVKKIADIKDFAKEPIILANKLVDVEKSKEGVFDVTILQAYESTTDSIPSISSSTSSLSATPTTTDSITLTASKESISVSVSAPPSPAYIIEYKVDSSRGQNHYLVKALVRNKRLYVATVQAKEDNYNTISDEAKELIQTLKVVDDAK